MIDDAGEQGQTMRLGPGATFSKVPRKILGKLLILILLLLLLLHSFLLLR